jgi:predicted metal-dependent peptidase
MINESALSADDKISYAKSWCLFFHPFFGGLMSTFKFEETKDLPTMAVSSTTIYWNRKFVEEHNLAELRGVFMHEVLHVVFQHLSRLRTYYDPKKWNIAADYAVNYHVGLIAEKSNEDGKHAMALPQGALVDKKYDNMSMEEIYKKLPQNYEALINDKTFQDGHIPDKGDGSETEDVMKRMVKVWSNLSSEQKQKAIGTMPEDIRDALEQFDKPKIDWRKFIAETIIDLLNRTDYTYAPRSYNNMAIDEELFLPRLSSQKNKTLVVVADTSGSVGQEWLEQFAAEMAGAITLADRTILMTNDADIHEVETATEFSDVLKMLKMRGGGGTDFRPPFTYIEKNKIDPECLIFLTDGWGPFPDKDPGYPVIWGAIPGTAAEEEYPKWSRSQYVPLEM